MSQSINKDLIDRSRQSPWKAIEVDEALSIIDKHVKSTSDTKDIHKSTIKFGSVLAEDILAVKPQPAVRTSVKDGYAVIAADGKGIRKVVGGTTAGVVTSITVQCGHVCRVNTGSMVPDGADAVVQVEDTRLIEHDNNEELLVEILREPRIGQDIREIGSDLSVGDFLLAQHTVLWAEEIGILAASERKIVKIFRQPKVAVMSTGHELVDSMANDCPLGSIRDSNRPQLIALFKSLNMEIVDMGIVPDSLDILEEAFRQALTLCDVIVCSGGVSMGEKDYVKKVLQARLQFDIKFGRVMMKPGLPTTFAVCKSSSKMVFALPGNPVSAFVTAHLFVLPALKKMAGWPIYRNASIRVRVDQDLMLDARPRYQRAYLNPAFNGIPWAVCKETNEFPGLVRLLSLRNATLLLKLPRKTEERSVVKADETVEAIVIAPL